MAAGLPLPLQNKLSGLRVAFQGQLLSPSPSLRGTVWKREGRYGPGRKCEASTGSGKNQPVSRWSRTKSPWALELLGPDPHCLTFW